MGPSPFYPQPTENRAMARSSDVQLLSSNQEWGKVDDNLLLSHHPCHGRTLVTLVFKVPSLSLKSAGCTEPITRHVIEYRTMLVLVQMTGRWLARCADHM